MNVAQTKQFPIPAEIGATFGGGFYAGALNLYGIPHALVVSPKAEGETEGAWNSKGARVVGAECFFDGAANTPAMAEAGSEIAKWAQALQIGGFTDWHLPSRDELELLYRHLKPTAETNACWVGDNPSSLPVGYAYRLEVPAQTAIDAFRGNGAEAFEDTWYWSSTQYAGDEGFAWHQDFGNGYQSRNDKSYAGRVRAVRLIQLTA